MKCECENEKQKNKTNQRQEERSFVLCLSFKKNHNSLQFCFNFQLGHDSKVIRERQTSVVDVDELALLRAQVTHKHVVETLVPVLQLGDGDRFLRARALRERTTAIRGVHLDGDAKVPVDIVAKACWADQECASDDWRCGGAPNC